MLFTVQRMWWSDTRLVYPANQATPAGYLVCAQPRQHRDLIISCLQLVDKSDIWFPKDVGVVNGYDWKAHPSAAGQVTVKPDGSCYSSEATFSQLRLTA